MKNTKKIQPKKSWVALIICWIMLLPALSWADPPDPPPLPPSGHGQNGDAPMGAPIDGGLGILLALGALYGGRKIWEVKKGTRAEEQ